MREAERREARAGGVFGGVWAYAATLSADFIVGAESSPFAPPLPRDFGGWLEALMTVVLLAGAGGAVFGMLGGRLAIWFRDRRLTTWRTFRSAAVGGFVAAAVGAAIIHLP